MDLDTLQSFRPGPGLPKANRPRGNRLNIAPPNISERDLMLRPLFLKAPGMPFWKILFRSDRCRTRLFGRMTAWDGGSRLDTCGKGWEVQTH